MNESIIPGWVLGNGRIDEGDFCEEFLTTHKMIYCDGAFFTVDGKLGNEMALRKEIFDEIAPFVQCSPARKVDSILQTLKMVAYREKLPYQELVIHTANGAYHMEHGFIPQKTFCRYRLPVNFNEDAPEPKLWLQFLKELLHEEDIWTLQEYMGYCLVPVTYGQKMLIITGKGGEGKSRIGVVMKALFGNNMNQGSLAKIETSPFARADLEHALVMVDDDLKMEALSSTNHIKSIVTAENAMDLERKGLQSYQARLTCRFMAFGNGTLRALHDRSNGFFRRQIILTAKEPDPNRVDDPYLGKRLTQEAEGILNWALEGLLRLIGNDFRFYISPRAQENMRQSISESVNIPEFLKSEGYIHLCPEGKTPSKALYESYREWCEDNCTMALSSKSFLSWLRQNQHSWGLHYDGSIPIGNGKRARGFTGIRICSRF